jgi:peptide/nickel transport system substrate-binding protein
MKRPFRDASIIAVTIVSLSLVGCSGNDASSSNDGTFTFGVSTDPGNLDPQRSAQQANNEVASLAYNPVVTLGLDGKVKPGIVTKWEATDPTTWKLTVRKDITCSDGTTFDASTLADNINYVGDPNGGSGFGGFTVPSGATAAASGDIVAVTLTSPQPFLLENMALLPMVCEAGLKDRAALATKSIGTGPYKVQSVVPGDSITYTLRSDYTPGLSGGDGKKASLPAKVVVKTVTNQTTTANLLLSGQLNGAIVTGTDVSRLKAAKLYSTGYNNLTDQIYFDHSASKPTGSVDVRRGLVSALDMKQVIAADTAGQGSPATGMLADPKICSGDNISGNLPSHDASAAESALKAAGWTKGADGKWSKDGKPLTLVLAYSSDSPTASSAAETVSSQLNSFGATVQLLGKPSNQLSSDVLKGTFSWDVLLFDLGFATPSAITPFLSGDAPPKGTNIGGIDNATFNTLTKQALTKAGTSGCDDWNSAEKALYKDADVAPTGQVPFTYFGKNATFEISRFGQLLPETITLK